MIDEQELKKKINRAIKLSELAPSEYRKECFQVVLDNMIDVIDITEEVAKPTKAVQLIQKNESKNDAIFLRNDGVPIFNIKLTGNRITQQSQAIILLMAELKNSEQKNQLTSKMISNLLFKAGIDTNRINNAFSKLRSSKPKQINSKPKSQIIFLTPAGDETAQQLSKNM